MDSIVGRIRFVITSLWHLVGELESVHNEKPIWNPNFPPCNLGHLPCSRIKEVIDELALVESKLVKNQFD
jgi:hypothetical protein